MEELPLPVEGCRLEERKALLEVVLGEASAPGVGVRGPPRGGRRRPVRCSLQGQRRGHRLEAPRQPIPSGPCPDWRKTKRSETSTFVITGFDQIAPGELEAIHVAENVDGDLRPCGQIRIGLPSRTLAPALDMLRVPGTSGKPIPVRPRLKVDVRFFGRHKGGTLRDGVLRGISVAE